MMQVLNGHDTSFNLYGLGSNVKTPHDVNFTFSCISAICNIGKFQILHLNSNRVGYSSDIKAFLARILYINSITLKVLLP